MIKTAFISDVHLGTKNCQATKLLNFLKSFENEHGYSLQTLYLVGDIIDLTSLARKNEWSKDRALHYKYVSCDEEPVEPQPTVLFCPYCGTLDIVHVHHVPRCVHCHAVFHVIFSRRTRRSPRKIK